MAQTIVATDPQARVGGLLVEVHADLDRAPEHALLDFRARMFEHRVHVGLLVTPNHTYVVRDLITSVVFKDNTFDITKLETPLLFSHAHVGTPSREERVLVRQVYEWLEAVAASWTRVLPSDAIRAMLPEVVGNLLQAELELHAGVLDLRDAVA